MMEQTLFIQKKFYDSVEKHNDILNEKGYYSVNDFFNAIIDSLNIEYNFFEIKTYKICDNNVDKDCLLYSQYGAFIKGENLPFDKVVIFFTPIVSKLGNVIIEQSFMPTICNHMQSDLQFLLDNKYKKIAILTSKINSNNSVSMEYNKLQMDINSLNTLNIDVIPFFPIKNLSTNTKFNSLNEYLDMSSYLQKKSKSNSQYKYLYIEDGILYGRCDQSQLEGEFIKSFCFRFLTAMFAGKNNYQYNIDIILDNIDRLDNQFQNLSEFIKYVDSTIVFNNEYTLTPIDVDVVECDDIISLDENIIHKIPEKAVDNFGRMRFKVQKKIRDNVLKEAGYLCNCDNTKHFYFESTDLHNYVEGHHIIPMNRQEEYYFDNRINLDNKYNIIPLCPNCHCQIHRGSRSARLEIISKLFVKNKDKLLKLNTELTLPLLASYYNIGLEDDETTMLLNKINNV